MFLNDIGKSPNITFRKINRHLQENYGFTINKNVNDDELISIMEQIEEEIVGLKIQGDDSKNSPEISKRLLILEGLRSLREFAFDNIQSPELENVIKGLSDFVHDSFCLSGTTHDDLEECIRDGMKHYRSSKYRFPDDMIEQRVRECVLGRLTAPNLDVEPMLGTNQQILDTEQDMMEDKWIHTDPEKRGMFKGKNKADIDAEINKLKKKDAKHPGHVPQSDKERMHQLQFASRAKSKHGLEEADPYANVGKRAGGHGGYAGEVPDTEAGRHAANVLHNPNLSLEPQHDKVSPGVKMVRNPKTGRMEPDPFEMNKLQRQQGIVHEKQNLVKNLRNLLETKVSQAEVMMAAKGFAQELQEMIEKIGRLQNEDLPPVTDQMRETYGTSSSSAFQTEIYGALQGVMDSLYTAKGQVDDAVSNLAETGQYSAHIDMDKDIGMEEPAPEMEPELDLDNLGDELEAGDEFGGAEAEEPLGRSKKMESVNSLENKIMEMRRLVEKAKKLKESTK